MQLDVKHIAFFPAGAKLKAGYSGRMEGMESVDVLIGDKRVELRNAVVISTHDGYQIVRGTLPSLEHGCIVADYDGKEMAWRGLPPAPTIDTDDDTDLACWHEDTELE